MAMVGASPEELRALAARFEACATTLEATRTALGAALGRSRWTGEDSVRFGHDWSQSLSPSVQRAASSLRDQAGRLRAQAGQQDLASGSDDPLRVARSVGEAVLGAVAGAVGGGLWGHRRTPAPDGGWGLGRRTTENPEGYTEPRCGTYGFDRDRLALSEACGDHTVGADHEARIPAGWSEVSSKDLEKLGIDPAELREKGGNGFSATLYRDLDGRYVLAFAGTDLNGPADIGNDVLGAVATSPQVGQACGLSTLVVDKLTQNGVPVSDISFTGHSLGGELASSASVATGRPAVTFNAAGLSDLSFEVARAQRVLTTRELPSRHDAEGMVHAYTATSDPLTKFQEGVPLRVPLGPRTSIQVPTSVLAVLPDAFGHRTVLPTPSTFHANPTAGSALVDHGWEALKVALDKKAEAEGAPYHRATIANGDDLRF